MTNARHHEWIDREQDGRQSRGYPLFAPVDGAISDGKREKAVSEPEGDLFARRSDLDP